MPLAAYFRFIAANDRFIWFGFTIGFASSFGQTFFVGLFGPALRAEFGLSHTSWGTVYLIGTLASALLLPFTGKKIDTMDLKTFTLSVCAVMVLAGLFTSIVNGPVMLIIAIFLLRQSGQGLFSHTAMTSMARYFEAGRGRALAIATMGFALSEAVLPVATVFLIALIGWRWTYAMVAVLVAVVLVPLVLWLLKGHEERHRRHVQRLSQPAGAGRRITPSWTRAEALRDPRFYLLLPGQLAPAIIGTAMFFHHLTVADFKGWSQTWMTGNYAVYAVVVTAIALFSGPLVDRFRAVRMVYGVLPPLVLGMLTMATFQTPVIVPIYISLLGFNTGLYYTVITSLWVEIYGVTHIGSIQEHDERHQRAGKRDRSRDHGQPDGLGSVGREDLRLLGRVRLHWLAAHHRRVEPGAAP